MPPAGFKTEIQASEQQQTQALDSAAADVGTQKPMYVCYRVSQEECARLARVCSLC